VERGSYGYAYTRGRFARTFAPGYGFAISTDYRTGQGFMDNTDDDSYHVKTRLYKLLAHKMRADFYLGVYRRIGGYDGYRRLRRDEQYAMSLTRQDVYGGQVTWAYNLNLSRSADFFKTIRPRDTYTEMSFLKPRAGGLYELTLRFGKEQDYINQLYKSRYYGFADITGFYPLRAGHLFFFGRVRDAENAAAGGDAAVGFTRVFSERWKLILSGGYLTAWPDLTDLYQMERLSGESIPERGNPQLKTQEKLTGNATLMYTADKYELSAAVNGGRMFDVIYYDRRADTQTFLREIIPGNDQITFADLNLSGSFHDVWLLYGAASVTGRMVDSDRYGNRPPYSPRWQVYGQAGMHYYVEKYKVNLRLFGDITFTERPLSYDLLKLETWPVVGWGANATLKNLTFYYMVHNTTDQIIPQPEGYGYSGWFYSWGFNFRMLD